MSESICNLTFEEIAITKMIVRSIEHNIISRSDKERYKKALSLILGTINCYCSECEEVCEKYWEMDWEK